MNFETSNALRPRVHARIPGGAHTYAKGDDQFPEESPGFIARGQGCRVWDVDGNEFIEYGMGLRAVTLGHAFAPVVEAAAHEMWNGTNFGRPSPLELECADRLASLVPTAEMVKFVKDGSTATSAAVRLARAHTGRDMVAICSSDPFYSYDDWFIGTTPMNGGTLSDVWERTVPFRYNDIESVRAVFAEHPGRIACLVMEAERIDPPAAGFLLEVQEMCRQDGALFVLDEMITGFRWDNGGAQAVYGLEPDLSTFGKAMANGFALSAIVGRREVMELGGWDHDRQRVFLASTTHGAETHALAAANAVMHFYATHDVVGRLAAAGERLAKGVTRVAEQAGVEGHFGVLGRPCNLLYYTRDGDGQPSQPFRTLFLQETIARGLLMPSLVVSYSHTDRDIDETIEKIGEALVVYRCALEDGVEGYLRGRPVQPSNRKWGDRRVLQPAG
jgi:glutamate-1-semialdehyde 2,1-aminomutase